MNFFDYILEGSRMARDARIGAVGAEPIRQLYWEGKTDEANQRAKELLKANTMGIALGAGAASSSLLTDLLTTAGTTVIDTIGDGDDKNLAKNVAKNAIGDLLGFGAGKTVNKIHDIIKSKKEVIPESIDDVISHVAKKSTRKLNKDNLAQLIQDAPKEKLDELQQLTRWYDGDWGLIAPLINAKYGNLHNYHVNLNDAMQKMRHGNILDSKFIQDATSVINDAWETYLSSPGGNNALSIRHLITDSVPTKKYLSHGISVPVFKRAVDRGGESIMPSLAILPQDTDNKWGEILFIGSDDLLQNSKIYSEDAWTPTVGRIQNLENKSNRQILEEMMQIPNERNVPELSRADLDMITWNRQIPIKQVQEQNTYTRWFFDRVPTKAIPGTTPYAEAKYQGLLPFTSFKHVLIPNNATDAIIWAKDHRMPYTIYDIFNRNGKKTRYPSLQEILEDSDLLFKKGGMLHN